MQPLNAWEQIFQKAVRKHALSVPGYRDASSARLTDQEVRTLVATVLERLAHRLASLRQPMRAGGYIQWLDDLDLVEQKMHTLTGILRTSDFTYADFFRRHQPTETQMVQLYEKDVALLEHLDEIVRTVEGLILDEQLGTRLAQIVQDLNKLQNLFEERTQVIGRTLERPPWP